MSKKFKIDSRLILQLGQDSIKDPLTALVELVKNSFDADASKVEVEIFCKGENKRIRVADNGIGMTLNDIDDSWLRIGYSNKTSNKFSPNGRRKTGEKGIGRIASDRLGAILEMKTKSVTDKFRGLVINWNDFYVSGRSIEDIELKELDDKIFEIPKRNSETEKFTGTELLITELRADWEKEDIENLYLELSYFSPISNDDFEIEIKNDIDPTYSKVVTPAIFDIAEIELSLHYDGEQTFIYEFKNRKLPELNKTEIIKLNQLFTRDTNKPLECGSIDLQLYFFVRTKETISDSEFSLKELKDFLSENYGVKLYRDNVVVKPYGFANNQFGQDWLGLDVRKAKDPAGLSRRSYKVNANNIVGSVQFKRDDNIKLKDSASREGLVENKAFSELKELINASIVLLGGYRYDIHKKLVSSKKIEKKQRSSDKYLSELKNKFNSITSEISKLNTSLSRKPELDQEGSILAKSIIDIENAVKETEISIKKLLEEKKVLNALATLGISSAVFGHETQGEIILFQKNAKNVKSYLMLDEPNVEIALEQISEAVKHAKLISSWGKFALSRIEKGKRVKQLRRIKPLISQIIKDLQPALTAREIEITKNLDNIVVNTFAMDIETIFINLLTNAYNAVPNTTNSRAIHVELSNSYKGDEKGILLSVADSGPGVADEFKDKIWEPLFTTRVGKKGKGSGTGLGLTIVRSIVTDLEGEITLEADSNLGGAKFIVWLPRE